MRKHWPVLVGLAVGAALAVALMIPMLREAAGPGTSPNYGFGSEWNCYKPVRGGPICSR